MKRRYKLPVRKEAQGQANVTSLVDVSLSLVIVFMVSLPFLIESGLFVSMPAVGGAGGASPTEVKLTIHLTAEGTYLVNENPISSWDQTKWLVGELLKRSESKRAIVSADPDVPHGRVVEVLDMAKLQGAQQLAILRTKRRG